MTEYSPLEPKNEQSAIEQEQGSGPDTKIKAEIQRKSATVFPYRGKSVLDVRTVFFNSKVGRDSSRQSVGHAISF